MTLDRFVLTFAGVAILLSLALGYSLSPYWFLLTAFVGLNLTIAGLTGFCLMVKILTKIGYKSNCSLQ